MTRAKSPPAAHSPGPWLYHPVILDVTDAEGFSLMELYDQGRRGVTRANGFLIAAAPDLLQAVKDAKEYIKATVRDEMKHGVSFLESDPLAMARLFGRAIAKAEGRA